MNNKDDIIISLSTLVALENMRFEVGLFENENKMIDVEVHRLIDNVETLNKEKMSLKDILYFVEHGTINTLAKPILKPIILKIKEDLKVRNLFKVWGEEAISSPNPCGYFIMKLNEYENYVNIFIIPNEINNIIKDTNLINTSLNINDESKTFCDLKVLKKYIKCKFLHS